MIINLNAVMSIIANVPAAVASTVRLGVAVLRFICSPEPQIVACRGVRRLTKYTTDSSAEFFGCVFLSLLMARRH